MRPSVIRHEWNISANNEYIINGHLISSQYHLLPNYLWEKKYGITWNLSCNSYEYWVHIISIADLGWSSFRLMSTDMRKKNQSSKDRTWSAVPDALLGVIQWRSGVRAGQRTDRRTSGNSPVFYRTSVVWSHCPALTSLLHWITPRRESGTADHVRSLDD